MTRETKIGLVLGLGFIVVFGILLSNRGTAGHLPPSSNNGDSPVVPPEIVSAGDLDRTPQFGDADEAAEPSDDVEIATAVDPDVSDAIELPVIGPGTGAPQPVVGEPIAEQVAALEPTPEATAPSRTEEPTSVADVTIRMPSTGAGPAPDRVSQPAPAGFAQSIKHRIIDGDTLTGLARVYYGTVAPDAIHAIYVANQSVLRKGPHDLKLNQQLTIPQWAPAEKFEPAPAPPAAQVVNLHAGSAVRNPPIGTGTGNASLIDTHNALSSAMTLPATTEAWDWYEMGPNDTLYGIAAKRLGSPRRWREIHELNKSDHPDPRRIRMGTRIKLPRT